MKALPFGATVAAAALLGLLIALPASAQQSPPSGQGAAKAAAKATKAAPAEKAPAQPAAPAGGDPLRSRVEQLEEQLVDLQVTIGTLESLARTSGMNSAPAARPPAGTFSNGGGSADSARVDALEIQLRALITQVEQLTDQVRALNSRRSAAPETGGDTRIASVPMRPAIPPAAATPPEQLPPPRPAPQPGFGSTTVTPSSSSDPIGGLIGGDKSRAAAPVDDGSSPKQLYETAYAYLLQQNYGAAESAFDDFLVRFPNDSLAGNAQYWLGESHFVRGQYKQAASAFLKGYQTYARSAKAPDSLLKLAMSLDRLGQRDAACTSYNELNSRFPAAPQNIKTRADSERRRIGCP